MEYNKVYKINKKFNITTSNNNVINLINSLFIIVGELPTYYMCILDTDILPTLIYKKNLHKSVIEC